MVYFIWNSGTNHVKVGHSADPMGRLKDLQTSNCHPLFLIGLMDGSHTEEQIVHAALDEHRLSGEWFGGPELFRKIRDILNGTELSLAPSRRIKVETSRISRGDRAVEFLILKFREKRQWSSESILKEARENGISKNALWSEEALKLPIRKWAHNDLYQGKKWFWTASEGWPEEVVNA